jgi:hypothetical protein
MAKVVVLLLLIILFVFLLAGSAEACPPVPRTKMYPPDALVLSTPYLTTIEIGLPP